MKARIYVDTSVIGGCEDDEFAEHSARLMECFVRGDFILIVSRREKKFDAVAMMRSIRDEVSAKIEGMTREEELGWLDSQELRDPFLKRLRDRSAQRAATTDRAARGR